VTIGFSQRWFWPEVFSAVTVQPEKGMPQPPSSNGHPGHDDQHDDGSDNQR
jgi:hypothetical protein